MHIKRGWGFHCVVVAIIFTVLMPSMEASEQDVVQTKVREIVCFHAIMYNKLYRK